jgi:hypothetical protein
MAHPLGGSATLPPNAGGNTAPTANSESYTERFPVLVAFPTGNSAFHVEIRNTDCLVGNLLNFHGPTIAGSEFNLRVG